MCNALNNPNAKAHQLHSEEYRKHKIAHGHSSVCEYRCSTSQV